MSRSNLFCSILCFSALGSLACISSDLPDPAEQVRLSITEVPNDVACIRVKAVGPGRTVLKEIEAEPGQPLSRGFSGLPLGTVVFSADAFAATCDHVSTATIPQWVSEEEPVSIVLGRLSSVALTMVRNGRTRVGLDFTDEPVCSAVATACLSNSECCTKDCHRGICRVTPDAGVDGHADALMP